MMRFQKIAGSRQPVITNAEQLKMVLDLDPALFAVMVMPVDVVMFDRDFLRYMDTDGNLRIRPGELKAAIRWMFEVLTDPHNITRESGVLEFSCVNTAHPSGRAILNSARLMLHNIGKIDQNFITLEDIQNRNNLLSNALNNGDGVIPPGRIQDSELVEYAAMIARMAQTDPVWPQPSEAENAPVDGTGENGICESMLKIFADFLKRYTHWKISGGAHHVRKLGDKSETLNSMLLAHDLEKQLDSYFALDQLAAASHLPDGVQMVRAGVNLMDRAAGEALLQNAPLALAEGNGKIALQGWINPLFQAALQNFFAFLSEEQLLATPGEMSEPEWRHIQELNAPYRAWCTEKPTAFFDTVDWEKLALFEERHIAERLQKLFDADRAAQEEIAGYEELKKILLYQRWMLTFVNNFVTLTTLFNPEMDSLAQAGTLIMDGRHFTLCSKVADLAEHKRIIDRSDICVVYANVTTGDAAQRRNMTVACAVTDGTMRHLFAGKTGIFLTRDGVEWDAKIIDIVQQPVSLKEALQSPFYRFGEFLTAQANKYFSARSKSVESGAMDSLASAAKGTAPAGTTTPATAQTPAVSGSLLLMGGGVGLAALGSAFAFLVNTLKNIPLWNVLAVLLGLIFLFSAPILLVSVLKLYHRSLSDFLAAGNWALNPRMRLSHSMGVIFTHTIKIPYRSTLRKRDLLSTFSRPLLACERKKRNWIWGVLLALGVLALLGWGLWEFYPELKAWWER